jgi:hypothetical protein
MIWPHNLANCYYADIGCNSAEGAIEFPYDALHVDFVLLRSKIPTSLFDRDRIAENPSAWRAKEILSRGLLLRAKSQTRYARPAHCL